MTTVCSFTVSAAPPSFTATPPQYVEAKEGGSTLLSCSAQGNPKPMISWLREGEELATNAKYSVRQNNGHNSDLWFCAKIEAGLVHRWRHPVSPSVLKVCNGLYPTNIHLLCCSAAEMCCNITYVNGSIFLSSKCVDLRLYLMISCGKFTCKKYNKINGIFLNKIWEIFYQE